jgi:hypothetical protein
VSDKGGAHVHGAVNDQVKDHDHVSEHESTRLLLKTLPRASAPKFFRTRARARLTIGRKFLSDFDRLRIRA